MLTVNVNQARGDNYYTTLTLNPVAEFRPDLGLIFCSDHGTWLIRSVYNKINIYFTRGSIVLVVVGLGSSVS